MPLTKDPTRAQKCRAHRLSSVASHPLNHSGTPSRSLTKTKIAKNRIVEWFDWAEFAVVVGHQPAHFNLAMFLTS
jgi:hypothetical protein